MSLPERTPAQRMQDDEDHRQAMCGLSFDARSEHELEDRIYQYHDFKFFAPHRCPPRREARAPRARHGAQDWEGPLAGEPVLGATLFNAANGLAAHQHQRS